MQDYVSCPYCGSSNPAGSRECLFCGLRIVATRVRAPKAQTVRAGMPRPSKSQNTRRLTKELILEYFHDIGNSILWVLFCPIMLTLHLNRSNSPAWKHILASFVYIVWAFLWMFAIAIAVIEPGG